MKKLFCVLALILVVTGSAWGSDDLEKGLALQKENKLLEAMAVWEKAASKGNGAAASLIGWLYYNGSQEIPKDLTKALGWYEKGRAMGFKRANIMIAHLYVLGPEPIVKDWDKAYSLVREVEDIEDTYILNGAYRFHLYGWGTPVDIEKAREIANKIPDLKLKEEALATISKTEKENSATPASDLITEVGKNQMRFDKKYKEKTITVSGFVGQIDEKQGKYALQLFGETGLANPFRYIECIFDPSQEDALMELNKGDSIILKGTYKGKQNFQIGALTLFECLMQ